MSYSISPYTLHENEIIGHSFPGNRNLFVTFITCVRLIRGRHKEYGYWNLGYCSCHYTWYNGSWLCLPTVQQMFLQLKNIWIYLVILLLRCTGHIHILAFVFGDDNCGDSHLDWLTQDWWRPHGTNPGGLVISPLFDFCEQDCPQMGIIRCEELWRECPWFQNQVGSLVQLVIPPRLWIHFSVFYFIKIFYYVLIFECALMFHLFYLDFLYSIFILA